MRGVGRCSLSRLLRVHGRFQVLHGCANGLGIATGHGLIQRLHGLQHGLIALVGTAGDLLALLAAALKGGVNRFAESIPQFLFLAAFQRDALGFLLPAVLQFLDGVDAPFATA